MGPWARKVLETANRGGPSRGQRLNDTAVEHVLGACRFWNRRITTCGSEPCTGTPGLRVGFVSGVEEAAAQDFGIYE